MYKASLCKKVPCQKPQAVWSSTRFDHQGSRRLCILLNSIVGLHVQARLLPIGPSSLSEHHLVPHSDLYRRPEIARIPIAAFDDIQLSLSDWNRHCSKSFASLYSGSHRSKA